MVLIHIRKKTCPGKNTLHKDDFQKCIVYLKWTIAVHIANDVVFELFAPPEENSKETYPMIPFRDSQRN